MNVEKIKIKYHNKVVTAIKPVFQFVLRQLNKVSMFVFTLSELLEQADHKLEVRYYQEETLASRLFKEIDYSEYEEGKAKQDYWKEQNEAENKQKAQQLEDLISYYELKTNLFRKTYADSPLTFKEAISKGLK